MGKCDRIVNNNVQTVRSLTSDHIKFEQTNTLLLWYHL